MNAAASAPSPGLGVDAALVATLLAIDPVGLGAPLGGADAVGLGVPLRKGAERREAQQVGDLGQRPARAFDIGLGQIHAHSGQKFAEADPLGHQASLQGAQVQLQRGRHRLGAQAAFAQPLGNG